MTIELDKTADDKRTDTEYIELGKHYEEQFIKYGNFEFTPELIHGCMQGVARLMVESNAEKLDIKLKGFSIKGVPQGDVELNIKCKVKK